MQRPKRLFLPRLASLTIYTDGAIRPERAASGLAAVFRGEHGQIIDWLASRAGPLTCNEAEYAAAIMALEAARAFRPGRVLLFSDSQVMVTQINGMASVRAPALKPLHARLRSLAAEFPAITFQHIHREQNRLADALANEIVENEGIDHASLCR